MPGHSTVINSLKRYTERSNNVSTLASSHTTGETDQAYQSGPYTSQASVINYWRAKAFKPTLLLTKND